MQPGGLAGPSSRPTACVHTALQRGGGTVVGRAHVALLRPGADGAHGGDDGLDPLGDVAVPDEADGAAADVPDRFAECRVGGPAGAGARGMGLPIVGELARQQGIEVICLSQKEKGTCIALLFPKTDIAESGASSAGERLSLQEGAAEK